MSGVVDVGQAVQLTFNGVTGADVVASWLDHNQDLVLDQVPVSEYPAGSGAFPYTFLPTAAGIWTALFTSSGAATDVERYYVRAVAVSGPLPLAVIGDVTAQYGALTAGQEALTGWLLRAASKLVRSRFPSIDSQITAGLLDADLVALGVANMVIRVLRVTVNNPQGLRSETVGPFTRTYDTRIHEAASQLTLTAADMSLFMPLSTSELGPVGTIIVKPGMAPYPGGVSRAGW